MRIHSLSLRNFRGVSRQDVKFHNGITVIEGPNEVGKSSLTEALRLVRDVKASSKSKEIKAVQPIGSDEAPQVEVEISTGPYTLKYAKTWLKGNGKTELRVSGARNAQYTGDEAHNHFRDLLEETLDLDLLTALDVLQGQSLSQARLASIDSLQTALGDTENSGGNDALMARIEEEYLRYFTATGRESKTMRQLSDSLARLQADVADLEHANDELERLSAAFTDIQGRQSHLRDALESAQRDHKKAQADADYLANLRLELTASRTQLSQAHAQVEQSKRENERRQTLVQDLENKLNQSDECANELRAQDLLAEKLRSQTETARLRLAQAKANQEKLSEQLNKTERLIGLVQKQAELSSISQRLESARQTDAKITELSAEIRAIPISPEQVDLIRNLEIDFQVATNALRMLAASAEIVPLGSSIPVTVDGQEISGSTTRIIDGTVTIEIPGHARVTLSPGTAPTDLQDRENEARTALDTALKKANVSDLAHALTLLKRKQDLLAQLDSAQRDLERHLNGATLTELHERFSKLQCSVTEDIDSDNARSEDELALDLSELKHMLSDSQQEYDVAFEEYQNAQRDYQEHSLLATKLRTKASLLSKECEALTVRLRHDRMEAPDSDLSDLVRESVAALDEAKESHSIAQESLDDVDAKLIADNVERAERNLAQATNDVAKNDTEAVRIKAIIADRESQGIYDRLIEAQAELTAVSNRLNQMKKAARTVDLLRTTLLEYKQNALEQYIEPFKERIESLGRTLFGESFQVEVSSDLEITNRTLDGITVPFQELSSGAREQLALLGRLACADLIQPGDGAPLILDDTLGFADPGRLTNLNSIITSVGTKSQIIMLTCDPQRAQGIKNSKVVHLRKS